MNSPYGYEFRNLMNLWDKHKLLEEINHKKEKIKTLLDRGPMVLFLKHKDNEGIFGADEPARITFARMMNPDDDDASPDWADGANFMATNLSKLLNGEGDPSTVFGKKDLKSLNVMDDKDKLIDMLVRSMKGDGNKKVVILQQGDPNDDELGAELS